MLSPKSDQENLGVVLHHPQGRTEFFSLSKQQLRRFILVPLALLVVLISIIFVLASILKYKSVHQSSQLVTEVTSKGKIEQREEASSNTEVPMTSSELETQNKALEEKLLSSADNSVSSRYALFHLLPGQKDLTLSHLTDISEFQIVQQNNNFTINFNITNLTQDNQKLMGYFFVILKIGNSFFIYPEKSPAIDDLRIPYNAGEPFTISRFRPAQVTFPSLSFTSVPAEALVRVFLFSRTGDLLNIKTYTPQKGLIP